MKYLIIPLVMILSACAGISQRQSTVVPQGQITSYNATEELEPFVQFNLFAEAHRCQGVVKYEAEIQNDKMRSRLTCTWKVNPNEWSNWE